MKKILPIQTNTYLRVECWTYYQMAIIQTLPDYMIWLSSHMDVFYYEAIGEGLYFGNRTKPFSPEYYRDILDIEEINLYDVHPDAIIDRIIDELNREYYYIVFLRDDNNDSHEAFIYGYDLEQKSFSSIAINESGKFEPTEISFEDVIEGYSKEYKYYKDNCNQYYCRRSFGYIMSRMKPSLRYLTQNYAYDYFEKIYYEVYGTRTDLNDNNEINEFWSPRVYYTGISCLHKLCKNISEINEKSNTDLFVIRKNLFKLLEHRQLISASMKWYESYWDITNTKLLSLSQKYNEACERMSNICYVFMKFEKRRSDNLRAQITALIEEQYKNEKEILGEYAILIRNWFCRCVLPFMFNAACNNSLGLGIFRQIDMEPSLDPKDIRGHSKIRTKG